MRDLFLVEPSKEYQKSFEKYVLIYKRVNDEFYYDKYKKALENFEDYLKKLPYGEVLTSSFWLVHEGEIVGVVRVRHREIECAGHIGYDISPDHRNKGYGSVILKLALEKAAKLGLKEVIVTCNINNIASKKIIEKNNGTFLGTVYDEEENEHLYKYSIKTVNSN